MKQLKFTEIKNKTTYLYYCEQFDCFNLITIKSINKTKGLVRYEYANPMPDDKKEMTMWDYQIDRPTNRIFEIKRF